MVIKVKKSKPIKNALRKLNEATIKREAQEPNMQELISRTSRKKCDGNNGDILIKNSDYDYA